MTSSGWRAWLYRCAHEWAEDLIVGPLRAHVDQRFAEQQRGHLMASKDFDEAMSRFAAVQSQGFANVRSFISAEIDRARRDGDQTSQANLARLDAGVDALAGGFAQFAAVANDDPEAPNVPVGDLPPVLNPDTPDPAETVSDPASGAPLDPAEVVADPEVPTPADEGSTEV